MSASASGQQRWQTVGRRTLYSGRVRVVAHDVRLPSGALDVFEVDESIPFAVAVLVHDRASGDVLLSRQYRYAIDRWILDLPGGAGEAGEAPEAAGRRECEEELGLVPEPLIPLHTFFPNPGRAAWPVHLFFADATVPGTADLGDESEQVELARMTVGELDVRIGSGEIVDPSLLIARTMAATLGLLPPIAVRPGAEERRGAAAAAAPTRAGCAQPGATTRNSR